MIQKKSRPLVI